MTIDICMDMPKNYRFITLKAFSIQIIVCSYAHVCGRRCEVQVCEDKSKTRGKRKTFAYERTSHRKPKRYQVPQASSTSSCGRFLRQMKSNTNKKMINKGGMIRRHSGITLYVSYQELLQTVLKHNQLNCIHSRELSRKMFFSFSFCLF